jgi:glutathione S-transferase/GST-like protein
MFKLYAKLNAGSVVVEAVLAACGAKYEIEDVIREAHGSMSANLYRVNPRGEVPTLILPDGAVMTESAAIIIHLADIFPAAGLAPAVASPLRPRYLRWILFMATTVYMSVLHYYHTGHYTTDAAGIPGIKAKALAGFAAEFDMLAGALGKGPFMLGNSMSALDIYVAMLAAWAPDVPALFAKHPNIKALHDRVAAVPAIAKVWKRNGT